MVAKLEWDGPYLYLKHDSHTEYMGEVRTRCEGIEYDYVLENRRANRVSEPYQREGDAFRDCEAAVRALLKNTGVEVEDAR